MGYTIASYDIVQNIKKHDEKKEKENIVFLLSTTMINSF